MKVIKKISVVVLIMAFSLSISFLGYSYQIKASALDSHDNYIILTEEIFRNDILGNEDIVMVINDICLEYSSGVMALSDDEIGECFHPVSFDPSTGTWYGFSFTHYIREITTPNGNIVRVNEHTSELPDEYIEVTSNYASEMGISATKTDEPTIYYNCHSYAWYWNDSDNIYWMNDPTMYYSSIDQSYVEVQYPREGDIICYFQTVDSSNSLNLHSGIVSEVLIEGSNSLESIMVESKWGPLGRYTHRGDQCPYVPEFGGLANEVRYYRPRTDVNCDLSTDTNSILRGLTLNNSGNITDRYFMYELNVEEAGVYDFEISSDVTIDERFYDENMNLIAYSAVYTDQSNSHHYYVNFDPGRYYFRVENTDDSQPTDVTIRISSHNAHTNQYINITDTSHTESCPCGVETTSGHTLVYGEALLSTQHTASCFCGYENTSNHVYLTIGQYNGTYHKRTCECGEYKLYAHTYTNCRSLTSEKHISTCSCGETKIENHDFSEYEYISQTQHVNACADCGTKGANTEPHVVRASEIMGNRATCLECGRMINFDTGFAQIIQNVQKVSVNGSYILPNGIIILVDEDVEAYLNGTLVFYDKDKVPVTQ